MSNNFKQFNSMNIVQALDPEHLFLYLSSEDIEQAKPREQDYSNDWARRNAWINRLAVDVLHKWLEDETNEEVKIWEEKTLHTFWEVVNGTALEINGERIILIPRDDLDIEEFIVPAEWIKISNWIGDYYLAIQVNLEDMWLRVWGCTTHKHICQMGEYDARWRNYCLGGEELISDINVMLVARKFYAENKLAVDPLPVMSSAEINRMISDLAQPSPFSPRYKVDRDKWCAILGDSDRRIEVYEAGMLVVSQENVTEKPKPLIPPITDLGKLLVGLFENGYQDSAKLVPQGFMSVKKDVAKKIILDKHEVILSLEMSMPTHNQLEILIKILAPGSSCLPHGLQIDVLDEFNQVYWNKSIEDETLSGIKKEFRFDWRESFGIRLTLGKVVKEEKFCIDNG